MAEARERLSTSTFDIALVDIQLGDGDGYTLCREIKRERPETDVILITGSRSEPDEKLFRSLDDLIEIINCLWFFQLGDDLTISLFQTDQLA